MSIVIPSKIGYSIMVAGLSAITHHLYMSVGVTKARKKYQVKLPTLYATASEVEDEKQRREYNSVQRAHQNSLEYHPTFLTLLMGCSLQHPITASILGLIYLIGRVLYFEGYSSKGPKGRTIGFAMSFLSLFGLIGMSFKIGYGLVMA